MYSNAQSCVLVNGNYSEALGIWVDVHQDFIHDPLFFITGGSRTMDAAVTIITMAMEKKAQQIFFALYYLYNLHNPPEMHLDFSLSF